MSSTVEGKSNVECYSVGEGTSTSVVCCHTMDGLLLGVFLSDDLLS